MADTRVQREVEDWLRRSWLPQRYGKPFHKLRLPLSSGGMFEFDAVSEDGKTVVTISTSGARTSSGKRGSGKLQKIRADALFLLLAEPACPVLLFTELDMFRLCKDEQENGRLPRPLNCVLADIPADLQACLQQARHIASVEVSPGGTV